MVDGSRKTMSKMINCNFQGVQIAKTVPQKIVRRARHFQHQSFGGLPDWMQDNEYLQFGHRPELNSFKECFRSIFGLHSETGNIWTHLIGQTGLGAF